MDRKDIKVVQGTKRSEVQHKMIDLKRIRMHPTFMDLLPIDDKLLAHISQDMQEHGYYETEPVTLGLWPELDEPVLIDGHARLRACGHAGITHVPCVVLEFEDETAALQHAMSLQTKRRTTTDGALYRLCERHDRLTERGGDRRSEEAISTGTRVPFDPEPSRSSQKTASFIGCNYKKVEKIRKIRKDGTPEIRRAVFPVNTVHHEGINGDCRLRAIRCAVAVARGSGRRRVHDRVSLLTSVCSSPSPSRSLGTGDAPAIRGR